MLFSFLVFSCKTTPTGGTFYEGRSGFALMPPGAPLYLMAEVQEVRPILDSLVLGGMSGGELKSFLDKSDRLVLAVFNNPGERHFHAAATGKFPSGGLFFSTSKDWEKKTSASGLPYWYSARSWLAVSLSPKEAFISDVDPFVAPPGATTPEALSGMQQGAVLSGWMDDPAQALEKLKTAFGLPIEIPAEKFLFAVYPADDADGTNKKTKPDGNTRYSASLRFEMPTAAQAAGLVMIFAMARLGMANADFSAYKEMEALARAFFTNSPRQDGSALVLKTGALSGKELALLFNTISVY